MIHSIICKIHGKECRSTQGKRTLANVLIVVDYLIAKNEKGTPHTSRHQLKCNGMFNHFILFSFSLQLFSCLH